MPDQPPDDRDHGVTPRRRLTALDGLRTIAVLLVFFGHCDPGLLPGGFIGVELFFVISGYLITSLLLSERETTGRISLSRFYIRRALRLYPALLFVVIVVTPIAVFKNVGRPFLDALAALTYVTDIWTNAFAHLSLLRHTWSLSVEEQFYIVWPIVLIFILRRRLPLRSILIAFCAIGVLISYALHDVHIHNHLVIVQYLPTSHLPELAAGILLALAERPRPKRWLVNLTGLPVALVTLAALGVALFTFGGGWWQYPLATVVCWPLVAHLVIHPGSLVSATLRLRPLVWLGRRSYAFYLWHYPIILLIDTNFSLTVWQIAAIALPLTVFITAVSWRLVESPCLRLKERFEPQAPSLADSSPGYDSATEVETATSLDTGQRTESIAAPPVNTGSSPSDVEIREQRRNTP